MAEPKKWPKGVLRDLAELEAVGTEGADLDKRREAVFEKRDKLIRRLAKAGVPTREIGKPARLSHQGVAWIVNRTP